MKFLLYQILYLCWFQQRNECFWVLISQETFLASKSFLFPFEWHFHKDVKNHFLQTFFFVIECKNDVFTVSFLLIWQPSYNILYS